MDICEKCGALVSEFRVFCRSCGEAQVLPYADRLLTPDAFAQEPSCTKERLRYEDSCICTPQSEAGTVNTQTQPVSLSHKELQQQELPPKDHRSYAVIGAWRLFFSLVLLNIPVVGWVFVIVWAVGGVRNIHLRQLARAHLICWAVILLILTLISIISITFSDLLNDYFLLLIESL